MTSTIKRRPLGNTGLQVSELGFGALEIGRDWAADVNSDPTHLSQADASLLLNALLDTGINFIDTAPAYWHSEEFIGQAISQRRGDYILATKVGEHCDRDGSYYDYSAAATHQFVDRSLQRLRTDVIDLIQIHSASLEVLDKGETWRALDEARRVGKVRFIGMTGHVDAAIRAVEIGGYDTVQVPFNLLAPEAAHELFPLCEKNGVGVIIMRGLAGGKLSQKYVNLADEALRSVIECLEVQARELYPGETHPLTRMAMRFLAAQPAVSTVIVGTRRLQAVHDNAAQLASQITDDEKTIFQQICGAAAG